MDLHQEEEEEIQRFVSCIKFPEGNVSRQLGAGVNSSERRGWKPSTEAWDLREKGVGGGQVSGWNQQRVLGSTSEDKEARRGAASWGQGRKQQREAQRPGAVEGPGTEVTTAGRSPDYEGRGTGAAAQGRLAAIRELENRQHPGRTLL